MGDIYEAYKLYNNQPYREPVPGEELSGTGQAQLDIGKTLRDQPRIQQIKKIDRLRDEYGYNLSFDQIGEINYLKETGVIDDETANRIAATKFLSEKLNAIGMNMSDEDIYANLDTITQGIFGDREVNYGDNNFLPELGNRFIRGLLNLKSSYLAYRISGERFAGNDELADSLKKELDSTKDDIRRRQDFLDRPWYQDIFLDTSENAPYLLALGLGGAVGGSGGAFAVGTFLSYGSTYDQLSEYDIDETIKDRLSLLNGAVNGFIEMFLWNPLSSMGGMPVIGKISSRVTQLLGIKGTYLTQAVKWLTNTVIRTGGEMLEEGTASIADDAILVLAQALQENGINEEHFWSQAFSGYIEAVGKTLSTPEAREKAKQEMIAAIGPTLVFGAIGAPGEIRSSISAAVNLRDSAINDPSKADFINKNLGSEVVSNMDESAKKETLGKIYDSVSRQRDREEARLTAAAKARGGQLAGLEERQVNEAGEDVTPDPYRNPDKSLYTRIEDEKREGNVVTGSFRMGDGSRKTESNTYGSIDYRIEDGALTITGVNIADHRRDLTDEFFQSFAKKFADVDIQWSPETEADLELRDRLIQNNRRGPEAGLNYFEAEAVRGESLETQRIKQNFDRQLAGALPRTTPESRQGVIALLDRIGKGFGMEFGEFLDRLGFDRGNVFTNQPNQNVVDFNNRAAQYAKDPQNPAGARGAMFKILKKLDSDVKAVEYTVVYLDPEKADYSTVVHELKHAVDNFLEQADPELFKRMMAAAGEYDPKNGLDENTWRRERSAYAFENYLQTGEAPTPELRSLFRQMVEWLRDIVNNLSGMRKLTPEQKAAFDELLTRADSFEGGNAQDTATEAQTQKDTANDPGTLPETSTTLSGGISEGGGKERYEANQKILADPAAGLTAKAQAALDDAGMAKAEAEGTLLQTAYHGTPHQVDRFSTEKIGTGEGAQSEGWGLYFAGRKEVAEYYHQALSNIYEPLSELIDSDKEKIIAITKESGLAEYILDEGNGESLTIEALEEYLVDSGGMSDLETFFNTMSGWLNSEDDVKKLFEKHQFDYKPGHLYEVSIPEDNELLDWDKPLSEQPENVIQAMRNGGGDTLTVLLGNLTMDVPHGDTTAYTEDPTGEELYKIIIDDQGSPQGASRYLNSLGIKGIRYLDGSSRAAGEGSYNYVIFDDSEIDITQTLFQTYEELLEDAARYESAWEFREAYEGERENRALFITPNEEREANIERLKNTPDLVLDGSAYQGKYEITDDHKTNKESVVKYLETLQQGNGYRNPAIQEQIKLSGRSIKELTTFGMSNPVYLKTLAYIPDFIEKAIYITEKSNNKPTSHYATFKHLVIGIEMDGKQYTIRAVIGKEGGNWYYRHFISEMGKGSLLDTIQKTNPGYQETSLSHNINDNELLNILQEESAVPSDADAAWYETFWKDARKAQGLPVQDQTLFSTGDESDGPPEQGDRAFLKDVNRETLNDILITLDNDLHVRQVEPVEPGTGEDRTAYEQEKEAYDGAQALKARINRELPHRQAWIGAAAKVANGDALSPGEYNTLRGYLRDAPRDYRALFADLADRPEWALNLTTMKDGVPDTPLSAPRLEQAGDMDPENRRRIAAAIGDPELARGILDGTIAYDDPRIEAFEKGLNEGIKKADAAIAAVEAEIAEDARKFTDSVKKRALELYRDFKEAEEKYQARKTELAQKIQLGQQLTGRYQTETRELFTDFDAARVAFEDYAAGSKLKTEVREELARIDARYKERQRLKDLQKKRNAVRETRRIKSRLAKGIMRKAPVNRLTYQEAMTIRIIQRLVEPLFVKGLKPWIGGPISDMTLQEVYHEWRANPDYREKLAEKLTERQINRISEIMKKHWDFVTSEERHELYRIIPKKDYLEDLKLDELGQLDEEQSMQLDIKEVNGKAVLGEEEQRVALEALGQELLTRIQHKPLTEWTLLEVAELAEKVGDLYAEGRENYRARQEAIYTEREKLRDAILETIKKAGIEIKDDDSPEEKKKKLEKRDKLLKNFIGDVKNIPFWNDFKTADARRFTTEMDGGREGPFATLMYWGENDAFNQEEYAKDRRYKAINKVLQDNRIKLEELFKKVVIEGLTVPGKDLDLTVSKLLYYRRGSKNDYTRQALLYGVLSSADERRELSRYRDSLNAQDSFAEAAEARLKLILDYADEFFSKEENRKFLALEEAIGKDWDENGHRLNRFMIAEFNRSMWREDNYITMHRLGQNGETSDFDIIEDLTGVAGAGLSWVDKGMTERRQHIAPWRQSPIDTDFYGVWVKSVEASEHLMAYAPLVKTLHAVFKAGADSGAIQENLRNRWGQGAVDWINGFIDEKANPNAGIVKSSGLMRMLRGKTATAYLAGRVSSILKQKVTSPWPYLQEIRPDQYIAAAFECAEGFGKVNDFIRGKSIYMRGRDFDVMQKLMRDAQAMTKTPMGHRTDQFNNLLMKGLAWADQTAVFPGWLAKYRIELARLTAERDAEYQRNLEKYHDKKYAELYTTEEAVARKALEETRSMEDVDYEAVALADDIVRRLQPSSRNTDQAPMFKQGNEFVSALLQFQNALGVIYKNLRYDLPLYVKERQVMKIVGMVTGYAMASIGLGLLVDWPFDDEDKDKEGYLARWMLYNSFTQFTDSVPFIGSELVTRAWEGIATGKVGYRGNSSMFPVVDKAFRGITGGVDAIREEDPEKRGKKFRKAAGAFVEAVGIYKGLPVSGIKETGRAFGIGDGDGEPEWYPEAFLGRKK